MTERRKFIAYVAPMALFLGLLALDAALESAGSSTFWLRSAKYWIYPGQTLLCGPTVLWFWREYQFRRPAMLWFGLAVGLAVFLFWIAPQAWLGFAPRTEGFNPTVFGDQPALYWGTIAFRFVRLVLVVPLVEEIFWRGFLLRFLIGEDFDRIALGTFSWLSFAVVTLTFGFSHQRPDWPAALLCGALYNIVAYRTKSLATCVITHALTNLLLGLWIMKTGQFGFW